MRRRLMPTIEITLVIFTISLLAAACGSPGGSIAKDAAGDLPKQANLSVQSAPSCETTKPPDPQFIPPAPWPSQPPGEGQFWVGDAGLWTALPVDGSWPQLALGEKFWWWSEDFNTSEDFTPDLKVTARRLDGQAPLFTAADATSGFHESFNWAMLVGVDLTSPGCWEINGAYKGHDLSLVIWVPFQ